MTTPTPDAGAFTPTVDFIPPPSTGPTKDLTARVAVVAGSGPHLSGETNALLQVRLRAAALFFVIVSAFMLVWRFLAYRLIGRPNDFWLSNLALILVLGAALGMLSGRRPLPPRWLKGLEFAIFGLVAAQLAMHQYDAMAAALGRRDPVSAIAAVKNALIGAILLAFAHGMLIPGTWRGAARVVLTLLAVPIAVQALILLTQPGAFRFARQVATPERVGENVIIMAIAAGLSIYGTHVINALRREAFVARQLNQYRLGAPIGSGGMGEVYLAEHRLLKRPCAIKLIRPEKAGDARSLGRFEREVRSTARLSHPNTVEIYDYGHTEDGTFYYVMEYLRGLSLAELVDRFGPMPAGRVVYLLRQASEALGEAHAAGLIHRDLKPGNIFAAARGGRYDFVKLLDFGLVKVRDDVGSPALSREGMISGTPQYMAPEQVTGDRSLDHRCDLYAMGAVAYTLLTGRPPFEAETPTRVMIAQVRDPVTPPSGINPAIPDDLERVVLRCLAKSPDGRYPDADALGRALAACESAGDWDAERARLWWLEHGRVETAAMSS